MESILEAFKSGDKRKTLVAMGERMADIMDNSDSIRDFAPAIKRMVELLDAIEKCPDANAAKTKLAKLQANATKRKSA